MCSDLCNSALNQWSYLSNHMVVWQSFHIFLVIRYDGLPSESDACIVWLGSNCICFNCLHVAVVLLTWSLGSDVSWIGLDWQDLKHFMCVYIYIYIYIVVWVASIVIIFPRHIATMYAWCHVSTVNNLVQIHKIIKID